MLIRSPYIEIQIRGISLAVQALLAVNLGVTFPASWTYDENAAFRK
jgi:hypothetical protein